MRNRAKEFVESEKNMPRAGKPIYGKEHEYHPKEAEDMMEELEEETEEDYQKSFDEEPPKKSGIDLKAWGEKEVVALKEFSEKRKAKRKETREKKLGELKEKREYLRGRAELRIESLKEKKEIRELKGEVRKMQVAPLVSAGKAVGIGVKRVSVGMQKIGESARESQILGTGREREESFLSMGGRNGAIDWDVKKNGGMLSMAIGKGSEIDFSMKSKGGLLGGTGSKFSLAIGSREPVRRRKKPSKSKKPKSKPKSKRKTTKRTGKASKKHKKRAKKRRKGRK